MVDERPGLFSAAGMPREPPPYPPTALTIVGGFLGAGKTTLINRLLADPRCRGLAVLVNDFGEINIDAELIAARDGETIALSNGCICCSLGSGLGAALLRIRALPAPPNHLVIEASGVSDPRKIAQIGLAGRAFRLSAIVVLADASTVRQLAADRYVGGMVKDQIAGADILVLNKCDLASVQDRRDTAAWLRAQVPRAAILETVEADLPNDIVPSVGSGLGRSTSGLFAAVADLDEERHGGLRQWSISLPEPVTRADVEEFLEQLPPGILRAKGFVRLDDARGALHVLQLVGRRRSLTPAGAEPLELSEEGAIVLIGLDRTDTTGPTDAAVERLQRGPKSISKLG